MNCDTNNGGGKETIEDHDEPLRDLNSRFSKQSERDEDESWFEADYEPEDNTDTEEIRNESDETKEAAVSERSHRYLLSSDAEDDDIKVIDVINHEKQTRRTPVEEVKASSGLMDRLPSSREDKNSYRSMSRSNSGTESNKHKYESSQLNHTKGSPEGKNENQGVLKEKKYSRAELEKVKAFFSANRNKRKESDNIMHPSKRIKGDYGGKVGNYRSEPSQEKLERKGKNFILNYIPYPSVQNINFHENIKVAFKDELNKDVLETLTPKFCGLCFKDLDDDDAAWKHYTGTGHKGTMKRFNKGTYKGHPPYWRMIHDRVCRKDLAEKEILEEICANYNVGDNKKSIEFLIRKNLNFLVQYRQIGKGQGDGSYFVINRNVKEVGKIFENYHGEKRWENEVVSKGPDTLREESRKSRRSEESPHQRELCADSASSQDKKINSSSSRHYSTSRTHRYHSGYMSNPEDGMLVVDPSNLRILPNGQIMIKSDDVKSLKNRTDVVFSKM